MTKEQRHQIIAAGKDWYAKHAVHVDRLMADGIVEYEPSGSDTLRPELWKPAHWRWWKRQEARHA